MKKFDGYMSEMLGVDSQKFKIFDYVKIDETKIIEENFEEEIIEDFDLDFGLEDVGVVDQKFDGYLGESVSVPNPLEYGPNATYRNSAEGKVYRKGSDNLWEVFVQDGKPGRDGRNGGAGSGVGVEEAKRIATDIVTSAINDTCKSGVVAVGDSLTARYTNGGWFEYLTQQSGQRIRNRGNLAQFGWNLNQMKTQVDQALSTNAETIYIMGGTNIYIAPGLGSNLTDALKSAQKYMLELLTKINGNRKVVILGIPPASGASIQYNADYCEGLNRMLQFVASENGAEFLYQWEHLVDKTTGGPDVTKFQSDLIHPIQINQKIAIDRVTSGDSRILGCYLPQRNLFTSGFEFFSDPLNLSAGTGPGRATGWGLEAPGVGATSAIPSLSAANSGFGRRQILDSNTTSSSPVLTRYFSTFPAGHRGVVVGRMKMTTEDPIGSAGCYFSVRFLGPGFELIKEEYIQSPIATYDGIFYQEFVAPKTPFTYARLQFQFVASRPRSVVEFEQVQVYDLDFLETFLP